MFSRLFKTKTFWAALAAIITAGEQIATGNITIIDGLQIIIPAILAIFLRDGVIKSASNQTSGF